MRARCCRCTFAGYLMYFSFFCALPKVNDMYYVDKKVSTWEHGQPHGSSSRICDAADLIDGIELEDLSNYWEFDMVVKNEKRLQTFRFVVSKEQLQKRKSGTVRKNFADPDVGFFQMDYFPARGNKPARWELTDPQDGSHSGRDGCKLVVKEATWKSWIDFYPIFTGILIAVLIGIFVCVRRFVCWYCNRLVRTVIKSIRALPNKSSNTTNAIVPFCDLST